MRFIKHEDTSAHEIHIRNWLEDRKEDGLIDITPACAYEKYMSAYRSYVHAQTRLDEENDDITLLVLALEKLPRLDSVTVDWLNDHIGSVEIIDAFGIFEAENLFTFDCNYLLRVLFRAFCYIPRQIEHLHLGPSDQLMHSNVRDLSHVIFPDQALPSPIPPQYPVCSHSKRFGSQALTKGLDEIRDDLGGLVLLRTFHIENIYVTDNDETEFAAIMAGIYRLLDQTPCLETIEIEEIAGNYRSTLPKPELGQVIPVRQGAFFRLRRLFTRSVNARRPLLLAFLTINAKTLVDLEFWDMDILDDDWASVLGHIREIKFKRLRRFMISWLDDDDTHDSVDLFVEDYVTHVTNANPVTEERKRRAAIVE